MRGLSPLKLWCSTVLDLFILGILAYWGHLILRGMGHTYPLAAIKHCVLETLFHVWMIFPLKHLFTLGIFQPAMFADPCNPNKIGL
jgi:hypothetical protein